MRVLKTFEQVVKRLDILNQKIQSDNWYHENIRTKISKLRDFKTNSFYYFFCFEGFYFKNGIHANVYIQDDSGTVDVDFNTIIELYQYCISKNYMIQISEEEEYSLKICVRKQKLLHLKSLIRITPQPN